MRLTIFGAIFTSCLSVVLSVRKPLDVVNMNRIMKAVQPMWKSFKEGEDPGSNMASTTQFCAFHYDRVRSRNNICNNKDFAVHCYNFCAYKGDIPQLECKDKYTNWCNRQGDLLGFMKKYANSNSQRFQYWFYYYVSGCYNKIACSGKSIFEDVDKLITRAPRTTTRYTVKPEETVSAAETTTVVSETEETTAAVSTESSSSSPKTTETTSTTVTPSSTTETIKTTTVTTTTTEKPTTTTTTTTTTPAPTTQTTTTTTPAPTTKTTTTTTTTPAPTTQTTTTTEISEDERAAAEKRPRLPQKPKETPKWKFDPGRWFNSIHFITG